jgi:hypothetical protein
MSLPEEEKALFLFMPLLCNGLWNWNSRLFLLVL